MRRLTLKNLLAHKMRTLLVSVVVMLGVAFVSGSFVLTGTINKNFTDLFATVYEDVDVVVRGDTSADQLGSASSRPPVDASVLDDVRAVDGVVAAEGYVEGFAQPTDREGELLGGGGGAPAFGGSWIDNDALNPFTIDDGLAPTAPNQVVIDAMTADRGEYVPGDSMNVVTSAGVDRFEIVGISKFGGADSPGGASYLLFSPERAGELFGYADAFSEINVLGEDELSQEALRSAIAGEVSSELSVATGETVTAESQQSFSSILDFLNIVLLIFAGIALFVGAFVISNVFSILVAQRTKELALLRALGATGRQVVRSVLLEGLVIGAIAGVVGLFAGIALAAGLLKALEYFGIDIMSTSLVIEPAGIIASLVSGVLVTVLAAYLPARKAARVPPLAAMRDVAVERTTATRRRVIAGLVQLVAGMALLVAGLTAEIPGWVVGLGAALAFLGVFALSPIFCGPFIRFIAAPLPRLRGVAGHLARQNAVRNPRRTASTAGALMIGVSLVAVFTIVFASVKATVEDTVDRSFAGDLVVASSQADFGGLSTAVEDEVSSVVGVETIVPQRPAPLQVDGEGVFASAVAAVAAEEIYEFDVQDGSIADLDRTSIAIAQTVADESGLSVGDEVEVRFAQGRAETYEVAATFGSADVFGNYVVDLSAYEANVVEQFDANIFVKLGDDANVEESRASIEQAVSGFPNAEVQDLEGVKDELGSQIDLGLNIFYGLLALAVIVALLGIASTLALSVFERTHEIGLLRAVGMSRSQLRSMVRWESILIAVFGTLLGLIVGLALAWVLVTSLEGQGITQLSVPWLRLVAMVGLAILAGLLAAIWPAARASRLNVLRAIATD
jgi:putative ABC transport system permease protein